MSYVRCPYCHCFAPASDYLLADDHSGSHFVLCPECDACIPLPVVEPHEDSPELEAA
jgi:hypothetical protein